MTTAYTLLEKWRQETIFLPPNTIKYALFCPIMAVAKNYLQFGAVVWHLYQMDLSLIVGLIALVMAIVTLPTAFQMYGGKPTIHVQANSDDINSVRVLRYFVRNKPITNSFLNFLGVIRQSTDIPRR
ncbi:hypothetical protein EPO44_19725 [bacterium]|nr:MAG: hypothetical protein EPO44_19725 [bacterium]